MTLTELRRFPETFAGLLKGLQDELSVQLSDVRRVLLDADIEGSMMSLFNQREAGFAAGAQHDLFVAALSRFFEVRLSAIPRGPLEVSPGE